MSGGHFDYKCFNISQFADDLGDEIDKNDDKSVDKYGDTRGYGFDKKTMENLIIAQQVIAVAGKLAREVEWLYSGDHGEDSFNELADKIFEENT